MMKMICGNCRYYTEGTIYLNGSMEHLCSCPASPFLDDPVVPDGGCYEFRDKQLPKREKENEHESNP